MSPSPGARLMERLTDPRLAGLPQFEGRSAFVLASDWSAPPGPDVEVVDDGGAPPGSDVEVVNDGGAAATAWITGTASLDLVVLAGVLRLVASPTALLDAAIARLGPGGVLLIAESLAGQAPSLHLDVLELAAAIAHDRGGVITPVYRRLQLGSVIQGYGLLDLHFDPLTPAVAAPEQQRIWAQRLADAAQDAALPARLRDRAGVLGLRLASEALLLAPAHRVWGRVPG